MAALRTLTAKQEAFAVGVAAGLSLIEAYRNHYDVKKGRTADSVAKDASELAMVPHVKARIEELKKRVRAKVEKLAEHGVEPPPVKAADKAAEPVLVKAAMDKAFLEAQLAVVIEKGLADEPVLDHEGNIKGYRTVNLGAVNRAVELLGKERGMFVDTKRVIDDPLSEFTHAQLRELKALIGEPDPRSATPVRVASAAGPGGTTH